MKIMGHRGARDRAPENTMRSFEAFIETGFQVLEFDIHQSLDGHFVVHHDDTLDRTTTSTGALANKTWNELSLVRTKEGDPLPRLEDVLKLACSHDCELQIEIKSSGDWRQLQKILMATKKVELFTLISFHHRRLLEIKNIFPEIKTSCLIYGLPVDPIGIINSTKASGISLNIALVDEELVKQCHQSKFLVTVWNANEQESYERIKAMDVDYLGTDVPYSAKSWT